MSRWEAHDELILASATTSFNGKEILVTGGNDDCIAIWDFGECAQGSAKRPTSSNGTWVVIRIRYALLISEQRSF